MIDKLKKLFTIKILKKKKSGLHKVLFYVTENQVQDHQLEWEEAMTKKSNKPSKMDLILKSLSAIHSDINILKSDVKILKSDMQIVKADIKAMKATPTMSKELAKKLNKN